MSGDEKLIKLKDFLTSESTVKALFITIVASTSAVISFSYALTSTKKRDNIYDNAVVKLHETGSQLAIKALKWGTFYALTGCGCIIFGIWKLANVKNMDEFRQKVGSIFPKVPKNDPPQSKTEFSSITEFLSYLDNEYTTKKSQELNSVECEDSR
ncbi:hypothetical protein PGB90_008407 [Kerria lacca]